MGARRQIAIFILDQTLETATVGLFQMPAPISGFLVRAYVESGLALAGGTALFDVNLNGVSIWAGNPSERLTIADGETTDEKDGLSIAVTKNSDKLTADFDGFTGTAESVGEKLTLILEFEEAGASATDEELRARSSHIGTQPANTVSDFNAAVDMRIALTEFTDLLDTPAGYTGQAGLFVSVNPTEDGLEFVAAPEGESPSGGASVFTELDDAPASYTGQGGKFVAVNLAEDGLEFTDAPEGESGAGGGAPADAKYIVAASDAGLDNEIVIPGFAGVGLVMPASPHPDDDEFDSGSIAAFDRPNASTETITSNFIASWLLHDPVDAFWRPIVKTVSGNWKARTYFELVKPFNVAGSGGDGYAGIIILPATDGAVEAWCLGNDSNTMPPVLRAEAWTNFATFNAQRSVTNWYALSLYLEVEWNGANLIYRISSNGVDFSTIFSFGPAFTPGRVGLSARGSGAKGYFDFLRFI